jgi:hypothetical protein
MMPFKDYSEYESGLPVVSLVPQPEAPSLYDQTYRDEINGQLAEVTEVHYNWPEAGFEAIAGVLSEYGMTLPDIPHNVDSEEVLLIKNLHEVEDSQVPVSGDLFLYLYYEIPPAADEKCTFYAEIVNERELEDLLDELNDETTNDDEPNEEQDNGDEDDTDRYTERRFD